MQDEKSFTDRIYAIIVLQHTKWAKNGTISLKYLLNKMDGTGNDGAKNDKTAKLCRRKMAGLLDFAHKVWYATVGILAQAP